MSTHSHIFFENLFAGRFSDILKYNMEMTLIDALTSVGRFLEMKLTGQSDFRFTIPFEGLRSVGTDLEGKLQFTEVKKILWSEFALKTQWPVLLEVKIPPPAGWKAGYYHSEGNLGRYQLSKMGNENSHHITVRPNLPVSLFRAILAHELVHAYQTEKRILVESQALREGMARWVEYHFLRADHPKEAAKLLKLKHFTFGKAVNTIVEYEEKHGRQQTLRWLRETL